MLTNDPLHFSTSNSTLPAPYKHYALWCPLPTIWIKHTYSFLQFSLNHNTNNHNDKYRRKYLLNSKFGPGSAHNVYMNPFNSHANL